MTHALLGESVLHAYQQFKDEKAVVEVLKANAPSNGTYFAAQGVVAAISFTPDMADKTQNITPLLIREFVSNVVVAFFLAWLLLGVRSKSLGGHAGFLAVMGLAAGFSILFSYWNWYEFSTGFILMDVIDVVVGWFLVGLILSAIQNKLVPVES